jgi:hypothetical protein
VFLRSLVLACGNVVVVVVGRVEVVVKGWWLELREAGIEISTILGSSQWRCP